MGLLILIAVAMILLNGIEAFVSDEKKTRVFATVFFALWASWFTFLLLKLATEGMV